MSPNSNVPRPSNPAALAAYAQGDHLNAGLASTQAGIERQELIGAERLRETFDRLPGSSGGRIPQGVRAAFTKLGFMIGQHIDDLFLAVTPPEGWRLAPAGDEGYRTLIVDSTGRERGMIFYKATFYDRQAHTEIFPRYHMTRRYLNEGREVVRPTMGSRVQAFVEDRADGQPAFLTSSVEIPAPDVGSPDPRYTAYLDATEAAQDHCNDWLNRTRPNWRDPLAYWDDVIYDPT